MRHQAETECFPLGKREGGGGEGGGAEKNGFGG